MAATAREFDRQWLLAGLAAIVIAAASGCKKGDLVAFVETEQGVLINPQEVVAMDALDRISPTHPCVSTRSPITSRSTTQAVSMARRLLRTSPTPLAIAIRVIAEAIRVVGSAQPPDRRTHCTDVLHGPIR